MPNNKNKTDNHVLASTASHRRTGTFAYLSDHCGAGNGVRVILRGHEIAEGWLKTTWKISDYLTKMPEQQIKLYDILANRIVNAFAHLIVRGIAQCQV